MKKIVFINGSPRTEKKTTSAEIISRLANTIKDQDREVHTIAVRSSLRNGPEQDFQTMMTADAIVIVFPLYYFCLPGLLMRFLQDYEAYSQTVPASSTTPSVYTIVNCGFPESAINEEAVRVIRCFSHYMKMQFRFGVQIGSGEVIIQGSMPPARKAQEQLTAAFNQIAQDIAEKKDTNPGNILIDMKIPKKIYYFFGSQGWKQQAKQNGLKTADLYRQPYTEE